MESPTGSLVHAAPPAGSFLRGLALEQPLCVDSSWEFAIGEAAHPVLGAQVGAHRGPTGHVLLTLHLLRSLLLV